MRLSEIMTTHVITTPPDRPLADALDEMRRHDVHHLVVVENGAVVGIVSARDGGAGTVRDAMHRHVVSATIKTTVREAANLMRGRTVGCLPVFDDERLVGLVTTTDLLELLGRGVIKPVSESIEWTMGRRPSRAPRRR